MLRQTPLVQGTCALTAGLNLKIGGIFLPIHPHERTIQKDSAYLPDLECYAETTCLFARFGVICRNVLSEKKLCRLPAV